MLIIEGLRLPVEHTEEDLVLKIQKVLKVKNIEEFIIKRRSLDARKKPILFFEYVVLVQVSDENRVLRKAGNSQIRKYQEQRYRFPVEAYKGETRPVIIGMGPAGMFAGLFLARAGFRPIIFERGKSVENRTKDILSFWKEGTLDTNSNVQFGEGGAGTFSDGKLNTLVKDKTGKNYEVLKTFCDFGAPSTILYDYKPHIGTDILVNIVRNIRNEIIRLGGEIHFQSQVTDFLIEKNKIKGLEINGEELFSCTHVILAPGHSARDTFFRIHDLGVAMEPKPFAVGFRVEHDQKKINMSQYGREHVKQLGNATYKITARSKSGRGIYSFCMCPGGYVVNASSEKERLCINGMSYSMRDGKNANSAIIISIDPKDYGEETDPLSGVKFQRNLEEKAYALAKGKVPVETYLEFVKGLDLLSEFPMPEMLQNDSELEPSVKGNYDYAAVHEILPKNLAYDFVDGMTQFGKKINGFNAPNTLIEGIESRTSSPLRILRSDECMSSIYGLFPCGEGAGFAGGITSAAMDGITVAESLAMEVLKKDFRKQTLSKRNCINSDRLRSISDKIIDNIKNNSQYNESKGILLYASTGSEIITNYWIAQLLSKHEKRVFLPVVSEKDMEFYEVLDMKELHKGFQGILEPNKIVSLSDAGIDEKDLCMIVPGICFDKNGYRIGYGGGYYDRYIRKHPSIPKIGICSLDMLYDDIIHSSMDQKVDLVITD